LSAVARENIVDEIKSRCDIVDVIGQAVQLKKAGGSYKGLCPFHNEKTPSFVVSESKQMFYCFGCNAAGDVFEFVQRYYNLDFPEAMEKLALQCGVDTKDAYYKPSDKDELYEINRMAARFFYSSFSRPGNPGAEYMRERGVEQIILKKFGVGYADSEWDSLLKHFVGAGIDVKLLTSLGLVSESKGKHYDKFRDRVMFPIINASGKVIGFGGRALSGAEPKYLNSPESAVFLKKNNLFGLNLTKRDISKENRAVLVEGYMDVISLYQHGVRNTCASLGTALTENQAKLIKRYAASVVLSYDSDAAGQEAASRGADILYGEGVKVRVLSIPSEKDPDEFIKRNGKQEFLNIADKALPYAAYKLGAIRKRHDISDVEDRVDFIKEAVRFLKTLSPVEAETYIKIIAADTKISETAITLEFNGNNAGRGKPARDQAKPEQTEEKGGEPDILEKNLIRLSIISRDYYDRIKPFEHAFASRRGRELFKCVEDNYSHGGELDLKSLKDSLDEEGVKALDEVLENVVFAGKEEQVFIDCIKKVEYIDLVSREKDIVLKLSLADEVENAEQIGALTRELMDVQREIQMRK